MLADHKAPCLSCSALRAKAAAPRSFHCHVHGEVPRAGTPDACEAHIPGIRTFDATRLLHLDLRKQKKRRKWRTENTLKFRRGRNSHLEHARGPHTRWAGLAPRSSRCCKRGSSDEPASAMNVNFN